MDFQNNKDIVENYNNTHVDDWEDFIPLFGKFYHTNFHKNYTKNKTFRKLLKRKMWVAFMFSDFDMAMMWFAKGINFINNDTTN